MGISGKTTNPESAKLAIPSAGTFRFNPGKKNYRNFYAIFAIAMIISTPSTSHSRTDW